MIAYNVSLGSLGRSVKLGQVAYAQPYPPAGLEWGQGWSRFAPTSAKVVLPRSSGGVGYTSEGTVLSQQDIEEISAATGQPGSTQPSAPAAAAPAAGAAAAPSAEGSKFPTVAAGVAVAAILASFVV